MHQGTGRVHGELVGLESEAVVSVYTAAGMLYYALQSVRARSYYTGQPTPYGGKRRQSR